MSLFCYAGLTSRNERPKNPMYIQYALYLIVSDPIISMRALDGVVYWPRARDTSGDAN